jgi:hypothetical protein
MPVEGNWSVVQGHGIEKDAHAGPFVQHHILLESSRAYETFGKYISFQANCSSFSRSTAATTSRRTNW